MECDYYNIQISEIQPSQLTFYHFEHFRNLYILTNRSRTGAFLLTFLQRRIIRIYISVILSELPLRSVVFEGAFAFDLCHSFVSVVYLRFESAFP